VTISGMETGSVIAAGYAAQPAAQLIGFAAGAEPGTWTADRPLGPGSSYEISTYSPRPTAAQLIAAGRRRYPPAALAGDLTLSIPQPGEAPSNFPTITFARFHSGQPPSLFAGPPNLGAQSVVTQSPYGAVDALARRLAAASPTPYAYVQSVLHLLSHYTYTQNPPLRQYPLASFLFTDREGYCQQFSGAMAMLLRMGGVPARVAAGFTSGTYDASTREWDVTDIDAHAWVEVWFPRYGWVRFDPTPVSAPARSGQAAIPIVKNLAGLTPGAVGAPRRAVGADAAPGPATHRRAQAGVSPWLTVAGLALLIAAACALRVLVARSDSAEALLAELERALSRTRRPLPGDVTLADLERRFDASPEASGYIRALRLARYGGRGVRPSAAQRRALRQELRRGLGISGAMRALWALPPRIHWRKTS
jgi:transglutaminase-like putative cysteine protease